MTLIERLAAACETHGLGTAVAEGPELMVDLVEDRGRVRLRVELKADELSLARAAIDFLPLPQLRARRDAVLLVALHLCRDLVEGRCVPNRRESRLVLVGEVRLQDEKALVAEVPRRIGGSASRLPMRCPCSWPRPPGLRPGRPCCATGASRCSTSGCTSPRRSGSPGV